MLYKISFLRQTQSHDKTAIELVKESLRNEHDYEEFRTLIKDSLKTKQLLKFVETRLKSEYNTLDLNDTMPYEHIVTQLLLVITGYNPDEIKLIPLEQPIVIEPVKQVIEPVKQVIEPVKQVIEPVKQVVEPVKQVVEPVKQVIEPVKRVVEPVKHVLPYGIVKQPKTLTWKTGMKKSMDTYPAYVQPKVVHKPVRSTFVKVEVPTDAFATSDSVVNVKMDIHKFVDLVKARDPTFIGNFVKSLMSLYEHKIKIYTNTEMLPIEITPDKYKNLLKILTEKCELYLQSRQTFINTVIENFDNIIDNKKLGLFSLIGREKVMSQICGILYAFSKNYKSITNLFLNISIYGSAGVGKSALAKIIAFIFQKSGILIKGSITMATQGELIGKYVGETAPKVREQLFSSLEGVLFIDEAYSLTPCPEDSSKSGNGFAQEAIAELINFMDKTIGLQIIIVAGYRDKMVKCFFGFNEGLDRRFPYKLHLTLYTIDQLTQILITNLMENDILIQEQMENFLYSMLTHISSINKDVFKNQAGDMLNLSNFISQSILMSTNIEWGYKYEDDTLIIIDAFSSFLESKQ